jgi:signal transduction histidine kinase
MLLSINQKWHYIKSKFILLALLLWLILFLLALIVQVVYELKNQEHIFNDKSTTITELVHQRLIQTEVVAGSLETILHIFDVIPFYGSGLSLNSKLAQLRHSHSLNDKRPRAEIEALFKSSTSGLSLMDVESPSFTVDSGNFDAVLFNLLRGYVKDMIVQYPHISSVTVEPRVEHNELSQFEDHAGSILAMNYKIKTPDQALNKAPNQSSISGVDTNKGTPPLTTSNSIAQRGFYYPVMFKEPMANKDIDQLGVDKYSDPIWRAAIDRSIRTQKYAITQPFTIANDRFFVLLKAVFSTFSPSSDLDIRHTQASHVLSITINPIKLLDEDELPPSNMMVRIYSGDYLANDPNGKMAVFNPEAAPGFRFNWTNYVFPVLHFSHKNVSAQQPYFIEASRQLGWELFNGTSTLISAFISLCISFLTAVIIRLRDQQRELRKNTNQIIFREKERALVTLHSINDAVLTLNFLGCVNYANTAALSLLRKDMSSINGLYIGRVLNLQYDFPSSAISDPIQTCLNEKRIVDFPENTMLNTDQDTPKLIEGSVSPLFDLERQCIGAVLVFRDLGPVRKKALAALEASEKRLRQHQSELAHVTRLTTMGEMASGIAHEINQPLTAILSYNQACIRLLEEPQPDKHEIIRAMQSAALQAKRAGKIISRMRSFVTKKRAPIEAIDINQIIQNVVMLIQYDLRDHEVEIITDLPRSASLIAADGIQIEQVIVNLIRNAMDAMSQTEPSKKIITLRSIQEFDRVLVSVKDNGSGISIENSDKLFNPFFSTKKDGMGLGLTISTSIVESYGGQLSGRNSSDGGAEFIASFPIFKTNTTL